MVDNVFKNICEDNNVHDYFATQLTSAEKFIC